METDTTAIIGIDFGTTNSVSYVLKNKTQERIVFGADDPLLPSVVYMDNGNILVGKPALMKRRKDSYVATNVKRLIGRFYDFINHDHDIETYGCPIEKGPDGFCWFRMNDNQLYSCVSIAKEIIFDIKSKANAFLGTEVTDTVISVPAYYSGLQRSCIRDAATEAGLNVLNLINEPTAAAITYGENFGDNGRILVFDLGGGTLDVTILDVYRGKYRVLSTNGNDHLGGNDFDLALFKLVENMYYKKYKTHIWDGMKKDRVNKNKVKLMSNITAAKNSLSITQQIEIDIDFVTSVNEDISFTISRSEFENCIKDIITSCLEVVDKSISNHKIQKDEMSPLTIKSITHVIMVGGGCMIPIIGKKLKEIFKRAKMAEINRMECVAKGCCICGMKRLRPDFSVKDRLNIGIGIVHDFNEILTIFDVGVPLPTEEKVITLWSERPDATTFQTRMVEIRGELASQCTELATLQSSEFKPGGTQKKEFKFVFQIQADGILIVNTYAMPENEKCLNKFISEIAL